MSIKELKDQLQWAIDHIEDMVWSIESGVNERGQESIFGLMSKPAFFDVKEAKALLAQLEEKGDE